jgi:hypothetical protein
VSLTGVYGFLHNKEPIPDLDRIACQGRTVVIIYDSDPSERSKGQVDHARRWLASVLRERGADVWAVILPDDGEVKTGLDDYLVAHSVDELLNLPVVRVPLHWSGCRSTHPLLVRRGAGGDTPSVPTSKGFCATSYPRKLTPSFWPLWRRSFTPRSIVSDSRGQRWFAGEAR